MKQSIDLQSLTSGLNQSPFWHLYIWAVSHNHFTPLKEQRRVCLLSGKHLHSENDLHRPDAAVWNSWVGISRCLFVQLSGQTLTRGSKFCIQGWFPPPPHLADRWRRRTKKQGGIFKQTLNFRQDANQSNIPRRLFCVSYATFLWSRMTHITMHGNGLTSCSRSFPQSPPVFTGDLVRPVSSSSFIVMSWWHHLQTHTHTEQAEITTLACSVKKKKREKESLHWLWRIETN